MRQVERVREREICARMWEWQAMRSEWRLRLRGLQEGFEGAEMSRGNVDELHEYFFDKVQIGQSANIPYREIRSQKNDPKWMIVSLRRYIGQKKGVYTRIYKRIKAGAEELRPQYNIYNI